jgi:hypothetical protein
LHSVTVYAIEVNFKFIDDVCPLYFLKIQAHQSAAQDTRQMSDVQEDLINGLTSNSSQGRPSVFQVFRLSLPLSYLSFLQPLSNFNPGLHVKNCLLILLLPLLVEKGKTFFVLIFLGEILNLFKILVLVTDCFFQKFLQLGSFQEFL